MFKTVYIVLLTRCFDVALSLRKDLIFRYLQVQFDTVAEVCMKEIGISGTDIEEFTDKGKFPETPDAACLSACVLNKFGILDHEGLWSYTKAIDHAKQMFGEKGVKDIEKMIEACKDVVSYGGDACGRGKAVFNCFAENYYKFMTVYEDEDLVI